MRVLVTGASGFLGGELLARLVLRGCVVFGTYRTVQPRMPPGDTERFEFIRIDLSREPLELPRVDVVVNAAGHRASRSRSQVGALVRSHVLATERVVEYARRTGTCRLIHLSSTAVYGRAAERIPSEHCPRVELDPHAMAQCLAEQVVAEAADAIHAVCLRLPPVARPERDGTWLGRLVAHALEGAPLEVPRSDARYNAVVDPAELERLVLHLSQERCPRFAVANVGTRDPMPIEGVAKTVVELCGSRSEIVSGDGPDPPLEIDTAVLEGEIGFRPSTTRDLVARFVSDALEARRTTSD